jgi:hypothetical protein
MKNQIKTYHILLTGLTLFLLFNCTKEPYYAFPTVILSPVTTITTSGAESGGEIITEGSGPVTARGICWDTIPNPTIEDSKSSDGSGTGSFTSSITGLTPGTTYYLRAYAVDDNGVVYSRESAFTTPGAPVLTTLQLFAVTNTTAYSGGEISSNGSSEVTDRGICWSTNQNPTTADSKTTDGNGSGKFISTITGLNQGVIYYIRAYATNHEGTAYGNQVVAITMPDLPIITDGAYVTLQKATIGKGVDLVFIGDGYTAGEIQSKKYENDIRQELSYFFDIEPYKSYSAYFNVYMVYAISEGSGISDSTKTVKTKFETKFDGGTNSVMMTANLTTCRDYAFKAPVSSIYNTTVVLVANSTKYGGTSYLHLNQKGFNVSICPMPQNYSRYVIQHEAGGHAFGNLADEYVNNTSAIPQNQINNLYSKHSDDIFLNVDITNDPGKILWKHFFGLTKYSYVNAFEGGFLYSRGVWRPELISLMSNNVKYINAPGRELIVKRIMKLAGMTYSFADFQARDVMELPVGTKAASLLSDNYLQLAPPVIVR